MWLVIIYTWINVNINTGNNAAGERHIQELSASGNINKGDSHKYTALHWAALKGIGLKIFADHTAKVVEYFEI